MYISKIRLKNIRGISELEIDLRSKSKTNNSLMLLGENGVGKSTVLKSVAIGLSDDAGASGLLSDMYGALIKSGEQVGEIDIELNSGNKSSRIRTKIEQPKSGSDFEEIRKETTPKDFPWSQLFVCGYGPHRAMQGNNSYEEYVIADAVYTLFNYAWELQNPELVVRRRGWDDRPIVDKIRQQLAKILMIDVDDIKLSDTGWTVKSRQGNESSFGALADGHRSTMNWILDLISWSSLASRKRLEPEGIVLIDEIEQHLHPRWQRHIMRLLGEQFPSIQFLVTSHSALCAAGIYERKDNTHRMGEARVLQVQGKEIVDYVVPDLDGARYDKVLSSFAFDTPPWPVPLEEALEDVKKHYKGPGKRTAALKQAIEKLREVSRSEAASIESKAKECELELELGKLRESQTSKRRKK